MFYERTWQWLQETIEVLLWINQSGYVEFFITNKMMIPQQIFSFLKILILGFFRGRLKGWKTIQNDEKVCLPHSLSQEPYIIWLSLMVCLCKMCKISRHCFHFFLKILIFGIIRGVVKDKKWPKMTINSVCLTC